MAERDRYISRMEFFDGGLGDHMGRLADRGDLVWRRDVFLQSVFGAKRVSGQECHMKSVVFNPRQADHVRPGFYGTHFLALIIREICRRSG